MTDMAMYKKKNERIFQINKYFGYDYIVWHIILAVVRYTICAVILAVLFAVFDAEKLFYNINVTGIMGPITMFFKWYFAGLAIYVLISLAVYGVRYKKARNGMLLYASKLKRLARKYNLIDKDEED